MIRGIKVLDRLNFCVREGEMVGIVGFGGNGSNELVEFLEVRSYKADYFTLGHQGVKQKGCLQTFSRECSRYLL